MPDCPTAVHRMIGVPFACVQEGAWPVKLPDGTSVSRGDCSHAELAKLQARGGTHVTTAVPAADSLLNMFTSERPHIYLRTRPTNPPRYKHALLRRNMLGYNDIANENEDAAPLESGHHVVSTLYSVVVDLSQYVHISFH